MKRIGRVSNLTVIAAMLCGVSGAEAGLRTQVGEAVIENLQIGQAYSLKDLANLNLIVMNTGEEEVDLQMTVLPPEVVELRLNAEIIPDISWVTHLVSHYTPRWGHGSGFRPEDPNHLQHRFDAAYRRRCPGCRIRKC
jgi:hypothetical protein